MRVPESIYFKLAVITYQSIHGISPSHLQSCFTRVADMTSRRRQAAVFYLVVWTFCPFVSLQSASGRFRFLVPPSLHVASPPSLRFQTTRDLSVFPFLPRHYHITRVLLSPFVTTVWTLTRMFPNWELSHVSVYVIQHKFSVSSVGIGFLAPGRVIGGGR